LVAGCALGRAFGVVFAVVGFFATVFAAVIVAFSIELAEDAGGFFFDVTAEDFVLCYLEDGESVPVMAEWFISKDIGCRS
jgi:hypothetical protein